MAKYEVTHEDGRKTFVNSDSGNEAIVKRHANHAETMRVIIAGKRGLPCRIDPSLAVSVVKIKE